MGVTNGDAIAHIRKFDCLGVGLYHKLGGSLASLGGWLLSPALTYFRLHLHIGSSQNSILEPLNIRCRNSIFNQNRENNPDDSWKPYGVNIIPQKPYNILIYSLHNPYITPMYHYLQP